MPSTSAKKKRNELIEIYLLGHSSLSDQQIANIFKVNRSTINRRRKSLVQKGKLKKVTSTVGKDGIKRKFPKRKQSRIIHRNKKAFEKLHDDTLVVGDALPAGLCLRPGRIAAQADRIRHLAKVKDVKNLPSNIILQTKDFHKLKIKKGSIDLILTDVVWSPKNQQDWEELAALSKFWLKPKTGIFASLIGQNRLPDFINAVSPHIPYRHTICLAYVSPKRSFITNIMEQWRPVCVFGTDGKEGFTDFVDCPNFDKPYHDWQQSVHGATRLIEMLSKRGDHILDPQVGTGTNAVAAQIVGGRVFSGYDIDAKQIKTARYRLKTEVVPLSDVA